jgi:molecular chaperone GrpE
MSDKTNNPYEEMLEDDVIESAASSDAVNEDETRLADLTPEELAVECEQAQAKADEMQDKFMRVQAEMENLRRRSERDVSAAHKFGSEKLIKQLLPAIDSLERGLELEVSDEAGKGMHDGMEMTMSMLLEALEKHGVKKVNPEGEPFSPDDMEAISMQPSDKVDANTVLQVVQVGYTLNGRLVRPAMVIVSQ